MFMYFHGLYKIILLDLKMWSDAVDDQEIINNQQNTWQGFIYCTAISYISTLLL